MAPLAARRKPASAAPRGTDFLYACTLKLAGEVGARVTGEILVNSAYDFVATRISWDFVSETGALPKVRISWRDNRRSYIDRPALVVAAFGMPGEDFPLSHPVRVGRGTTLSFDAINAEAQECELDVVIHGVELRPAEG